MPKIYGGGVFRNALTHQAIGPVPLGLLVGAILGALTLLLLENKRLPAAIVIVGADMVIILLIGTREGLGQLRPSLYLPTLLPFGIPTPADLTFALMVLVLPQIPMTVGNAVVANDDLSLQYFPQDGRRVTYKALCLSMALGNLMSFILGGMPMCHGAGGLASYYRFGARTAGSNLIIGVIFVLLALLLGEHLMGAIYLRPMAAIGTLLFFAGAQLSLTLLDMNARKEMFVPVLMVGITLASDLDANAANNLRVLNQVAAELLAAVAENNLPRIDVDLFFEVFSPTVAKPQRNRTTRAAMAPG